MLLYRIEYKDSVAVAYRICFEQQELFPFAIADFTRDILYLDRNRDAHVDEMVAPANLKERSLTEDLPFCIPKPSSPQDNPFVLAFVGPFSSSNACTA